MTFAHDIAILSGNIDTARVQIELLKEITEQTGLYISFEKTEVMINIKDAQPKLCTKYGVIARLDKLKYLGEIIIKNRLNKEVLREWICKLETAYQVCCMIYFSKTLRYITTK